MGSSASLLAASKLLDLIGAMPDNVVEQSDAPQAYTQSLLWGEPLGYSFRSLNGLRNGKGTKIQSVNFAWLSMATLFQASIGNAIRGTVCSL